MAKVQLSVACWDYDRIRPLMDGRVVAEGLDLVFLPLTPEEAFFRAFRHAEFDVSELSLSTTLMTLSQGKCPYMPIPVFPSRAFRHSCIYVRPGAGIATPQDLKGRRVGIPEYQVTAAMVARGVLADEYGVQPKDLHWVQGGMDEPGRIDKVQWTPPAGLTLDKVMDRSLGELIAAGELDAIVAPRAPRAFRPAGDGPLVRLFPDHERVEADWYGKTGIFPIMHVLGVRHDVLGRHPWVAMSLVKAFTAAKDMALADLAQVAALKTSLPFLPAHVAQAHRLFGTDFWPYGVDANRRTLDAELRWSHEQGLSTRKVEIADLFAPQSVLGHRV
jgi:4,5-dihydroxyphthalate decarboxylase